MEEHRHDRYKNERETYLQVADACTRERAHSVHSHDEEEGEEVDDERKDADEAKLEDGEDVELMLYCPYIYISPCHADEDVIA